MKHWKQNIALFLVGQGLTLFGSSLVHYAIVWHVTLKTQSGVMMALVTAAGALPTFFISPFGGVWADRFNKKYIINIADAAIAAVTLMMAVLFTLDFNSTALLIVCLAVRALGQGVQTPAVNALVPELVPQEQLTRINGISSGVQSFVMFSSPIAGAALLGVFPIHILMYMDVVTAVIGISVLVFFVRVPDRKQKSEGAIGAAAYFRDIGAGVRYVIKKTFLVKFLMLSALFNIMAAPMATLTPLQIARNYGDDIWMLFGGFSFGAEQRLALAEVVFFVGMMLGGVLIAVWGGFKNRTHTMALSTFLLGIGAVGLGVITNLWIYMLCMGFIGIVLNMFNAPMMSTMQSNVDGAYMGRVFSVLSMMSSLMMPLSMIFWGLLADRVAVDWLLVGTGIVIFMMGFIFVLDKTLLKAGRTKPAAGEADVPQ